MDFYIKYLDCKNNFRETKKYFETYEQAETFARSTFETFNPDFIKIK